MKAFGEIERDKLRVARAYDNRVKEKATSSKSGHQIGKDRIESRK
jgi:hypothetical protein